MKQIIFAKKFRSLCLLVFGLFVSGGPASAEQKDIMDTEYFRGQIALGRGEDSSAFSIFMRSCQKDEIASCRVLSSLYANGIGTEPDDVESLRLLQKACLGRDTVSCAMLGNMFVGGIGVEKDYGSAAVFYRTACDLGSSSACANLAHIFENGLGVERDIAKAESLR